MEDAALVGIDLGKHSFHLHGQDKNGKEVFPRKVTRKQLVQLLANFPTCTIAMEACSGAHFMARTLSSFGHKVRLIAPHFVRPFVKSKLPQPPLPQVSGSAAHQWLEARNEDLLPVEYYHVVFTLPAHPRHRLVQQGGDLWPLVRRRRRDCSHHYRRFEAPRRADWREPGAAHQGTAFTHHPHVHVIVPGGGLALDGERWVACRPGFFLPVRVLPRLFRRRFLETLQAGHGQGQLRFFGDYTALADPDAIAQWIAPLRNAGWVVYAKRPFAGPEAVLAYLSRYAHRVAISNHSRNRRMNSPASQTVVPVRWTACQPGASRKPGLARELLNVEPDIVSSPDNTDLDAPTPFRCRHCGAPLLIMEVIPRSASIRGSPPLRALR